MDNNFLIFGNDEKMKSCRNRLHELGFEAEIYEGKSTDIFRKYKFIILPLPTFSDGLITETDMTVEMMNSCLGSENIVFCGNVSADIFACRAFSYYENEDFLLKNSFLTAQGVLKIILENIKTDLRCVSVAVIGYGRCGREICRLLKNAGFNVTSFSRRSETLRLSEAEKIKAENCTALNEKISSFDITVNTVPANIIEKKTLQRLGADKLYIEVASAPYGISPEQAKKCKFRYIHAKGLPGRFTPVRAGQNIADTVTDIIKEGIKL